MTSNGVMALILRYFTEFGSLRGALRKSGWRCRRKKVHAFAISSPDEFLVDTWSRADLSVHLPRVREKLLLLSPMLLLQLTTRGI